MVQLYALQFDLVTPPPRSTSVIVWLEGSPCRSVPVDPNLDWLDVRQGDELIVGGKRRTVVAVRVYRGDARADVPSSELRNANEDDPRTVRLLRQL